MAGDGSNIPDRDKWPEERLARMRQALPDDFAERIAELMVNGVTVGISNAAAADRAGSAPVG